ncbi:MAG: UDP-N-acetylmuramoyl-tripeptide--D-alanyl-D-alanine ligase [Oscillospiraceae bacterium]|jgi:UDP-N-acetylmuramoyl-tripeptide--D-alanyl-D-alanine ligase|nr:UDP-N-acetylmuramoyl-tripeptide--D-alanyl-D-alanine ligase [Oscillospiraceae bacterium]
MEFFLVSDIFSALKGQIISSDTIDMTLPVTAVSTDTRTIAAGDVFVALKGENFDGHDYVQKAIDSGAVCAITQRRTEGCPCITVKSSHTALLKLAEYYRKKFDLILVGITGSAGKTTTKEMIASVLEKKYNTLKTLGNLNNAIGLPKTLFGLKSQHEAAVIEMGMSDFGEIERLSVTANPTVGVITNIGYSHIQNLKTQEGILQAKLEIVKGMESASPLVVNADDKYLKTLKGKVRNPVYSYSTDSRKSDVYAESITESGNTTEFDIIYQHESLHIKLNCLGRHNILNALAAFCVGQISKVPAQDIAAALSEYTPPELRQNVVVKNGITYIIDCYNASPDSMKAALDVLKKMPGRKIAVLGDMLELGDMSRQLHEYVGSLTVGVDKLYTYGKEAAYINAGAQKHGGVPSGNSEYKEHIAEWLKENLRQGDAVLFKASRGMKLEKIVEEICKSGF